MMTRDRFESIRRCLHVANTYTSGGAQAPLQRDKIAKVRWLVEDIRGRCQNLWNLHQQVTVDESVVRYKGQYCSIRQYMPRKPCRFGIKVWSLDDAVVKYLWNFEVYCGKEGEPIDYDFKRQGEPIISISSSSGKGMGLQGALVVKNLMQSLHGRGYIVTVDNFFTSVPLFMDLLENGIMATGTLRSDGKYVPRDMWAKENLKNKVMGWCDWRMHSSGKICCMVWKDSSSHVCCSYLHMLNQYL